MHNEYTQYTMESRREEIRAAPSSFPQVSEHDILGSIDSVQRMQTDEYSLSFLCNTLPTVLDGL
jgi:hypothetical protein